MKKHSYRQTDINKVDWVALQSKTNNAHILFSIDVAKQDFVGVLLTKDKEIISTIKWKHPEETLGLLEHLCNDLQAARLEVAMESTGTYGDALRWQFNQRNITVYRVNSKYTHDLAESFDGVPSSHDAKAAHIIAELHLNGRSDLWQEASVEQRDLRGMVSELEVFQTVHRANLNRLGALLARHWPELEYTVSLHNLSTLRLLAEYGEPRRVASDESQAVIFLRKAGGGGLKETKCQAILIAAKNSMGIPCTPGERNHIQQLAIDLIRTYKASSDVEKGMAQMVKEHEEVTEVAALCGKTSCIVLMALLGDLRVYANAQSLLKACGLNLKEHSSGKYKGQLKITKRGSGKVRFYLYWLALRLIKNDLYVKGWYQRKIIRDGTRHRGRAVIAVMRKVTKALWHVAQGETFDSSKLFNSTEVNA